MIFRVMLLSLTIFSGLFFFDYQKISSNTHSEIEYAKQLKKINEILIGYQILHTDTNTRSFSRFMSYFWQSGYYHNLYFIYEKDGLGLFSDPSENPEYSPVGMRTRPWYLCAKKLGSECIGGKYENIFPPHDLMYTYSYPIYINDRLIGVGAYDLDFESLHNKTIGFFSIKNIRIKDQYGHISFDFEITRNNAFLIVVTLAALLLLSFTFINIVYFFKSKYSHQKKDQLTGLKRRDSFKSNKLDNRVKSFCFLDIDHFKKINDTYGHDTGDDVIKAFADCLKENIRDKDVAFRWGGEEFLVLIRSKIDENIDVYKILERVRASVEAMDVDGLPKFTVSIGYCDYNANTDVKELIKQADFALYESKRTGRNKVSQYKIEYQNNFKRVHS